MPLQKRSGLLLTCLSCVAIALGLLSPPGPRADTPSSSSVAEEVKVSLRLIDVLATSKKGEPLLGLGPEDFTVLVDGKEREIRTFDAAAATPSAIEAVASPGSGESVSVAGAGAADDPGRWVVILLDTDRMPHNYRKVVLNTARAIVAEPGSEKDRFAIALLRNGNLHFLQEFSRRDNVDMGIFDDPGRLISNADDLRRRVTELVTLVKDCGQNAFPDACVMTRSEEFLNGITSENASGFSALNGLISAMKPLPGRKALIWFSNGFVLRPGDVVQEVVTRWVGTSASIASRLERRDYPYTEELVSAASRAQVSFFALRAGNDFSHVMRGADTATLEQPIDRQAGNPYKRAVQMSEEVLRDIADGTGGRAVMTPLNPKLAEGLLDRLDGVYTLGIDVSPEDSPRSKLRVKLNRKKSVVQVKKRISRRGPPAPKLVADFVQVPSSVQDRVDLVLSVDLDLVRTEKDRDSGVNTSRLAYYAILRNPDGKVVDEIYRIQEVLRGDASETHFNQRISFAQPEGEYQAEVTVSDLIGNGFTSAVALTAAAQPVAAN